MRSFEMPTGMVWSYTTTVRSEQHATGRWHGTEGRAKDGRDGLLLLYKIMTRGYRVNSHETILTSLAFWFRFCDPTNVAMVGLLPLKIGR